MKFTELDARMRIFETAHDHCIIPGIYIVARIDGRNFTTLTKDKHNFEAPFDTRFSDMMNETVIHLMNCGFKIIYGFTESDEISLLLHRNEKTFQRKERKLNSIFAGEASAKFSVLLGDVAAFDCRISQLPSKSDVVDYFRWRNEDAARNGLNAHCYWALRKEGLSASDATLQIKGKSNAEKNEMLFSRGINFNSLPSWQKRGTGFYIEEYEKDGFNPQTGETVKTKRKQIKIDSELPMKDEYSDFVRKIIDENE
jgi:tRNA(His) guanylyltransferase